jgi:hypothetical protein
MPAATARPRTVGALCAAIPSGISAPAATAPIGYRSRNVRSTTTQAGQFPATPSRPPAMPAIRSGWKESSANRRPPAFHDDAVRQSGREVPEQRLPVPGLAGGVGAEHDAAGVRASRHGHRGAEPAAHRQVIPAQRRGSHAPHVGETVERLDQGRIVVVAPGRQDDTAPDPDRVGPLPVADEGAGHPAVDDDELHRTGRGSEVGSGPRRAQDQRGGQARAAAPLVGVDVSEPAGLQRGPRCLTTGVHPVLAADPARAERRGRHPVGELAEQPGRERLDLQDPALGGRAGRLRVEVVGQSADHRQRNSAVAEEAHDVGAPGGERPLELRVGGALGQPLEVPLRPCRRVGDPRGGGEVRRGAPQLAA